MLKYLIIHNLLIFGIIKELFLFLNNLKNLFALYL